MPDVEREIEKLFDARLETIAREIESRQGNKLYRRAWAIAAYIIRKHKGGKMEPVGNFSFPSNEYLAAVRNAHAGA